MDVFFCSKDSSILLSRFREHVVNNWNDTHLAKGKGNELSNSLGHVPRHCVYFRPVTIYSGIYFALRTAAQIELPSS